MKFFLEMLRVAVAAKDKAVRERVTELERESERGWAETECEMDRAAVSVG